MTELTDSFFVQWVLVCGRLNCDPIDLIRVSYSESGVNPAAHNPNGNAVGLVQMMPSTLRGLGWTKGWEEFAALSAEEQIPFVERYFRVYQGKLETDALCYVATFLPAKLNGAIVVGENFVLCARSGDLSWAYAANTVLDADRDGAITVGDLKQHLATVCVGPRYIEIERRIREVVAKIEAPTDPNITPVIEDDGGQSRIDATTDAVLDGAESDVEERNS